MKASTKPTFTAVSMAVFIALAASTLAQAAVYKYIDENGKVAYGDKPVEGSEKMTIRGIPRNSEESERSEEDSDTRTADKGGENIKYRSLEILTPKPGKVIDDRSGAVQVIFLPSPSLGKADQLVITVDGKDISKGRDANLSLTNLPGGTHTVSGKIIDANGKEKISTTLVTFQVGKNAALALDDDNY